MTYATGTTRQKALQLAFCIFGIYVFFLSWGILQERITTLDYASHIGKSGSSGHFLVREHPFTPLLRSLASFKDNVSEGVVRLIFHLFPAVKDWLATQEYKSENGNKFDFFVFLNLSQCLVATIIGFFLVLMLRPSVKSSYSSSSSSVRSLSTSNSTSTSTSTSSSSFRVSSSQAPYNNKFPPMTASLFFSYLKISISYCCASPFGYSSLKHIDYVTMNLGKSCKLLPVLFLSLFMRKSKVGRSIDTSKIVGVLLITLGVTGFMLFDEGKKSKKANVAFTASKIGDTGADGSLWNAFWSYIESFVAWFGSNSLYGVGLLFMNLLLDGATNTWQDDIFHQYQVSSLHMMFHMNWISSMLMILFLLLNPWTTELSSAFAFLLRHPHAISDLFLFAMCGALGQAFVFYTIEGFGALSLVTVTVTRKLFTILLSVAYFGHVLNLHQWCCVGVVFAALIMETLISLRKQKSRSSPEPLSIGSRVSREVSAVIIDEKVNKFAAGASKIKSRSTAPSTFPESRKEVLDATIPISAAAHLSLKKAQ